MKKIEKNLKMCVVYPDFLSISGSRLYGTDTPQSDFDDRGFTIPPFEYLIGTKKFESMELEGDYKVYSLHRFLELVIAGDPQCSELFFAKQKHIKMLSNNAKKILALKDSIISNRIFSRIMGYSNGEWRKAMAIKIVPEKVKKTETQIINELWNEFPNLNKQQKDNIREILYENREKEIVSSVAGLGSKRKKNIEEYGYCTKSAAHSIRLVNQVEELMLTGNITFPRPNASMLKKIRFGEMTKEEVTVIYEESRIKAEEARPKSILINKPDINKIWEVYTQIISDYIQNKYLFENK